MRQLLLILAVLASCFWSMPAWSAWTDWEVLYEDQDITVEISFTLRDSSCVPGNKLNKLRYNVTGKLKSRDFYYVNWKMDYIHCNGDLYTEERHINIGKEGSKDIVASIDDRFTAQSIKLRFYDVEPSTTARSGTKFKSKAVSRTPDKILGKREIYRGLTNKLSVSGGALGLDARWVWYADECGENRVGEGSSISVGPMKTTTYYVRAEDRKGATECASFRLLVNQSSREPEMILGKKDLCKGERTTLTVSGGNLNEGAKWAWYESMCGGTAIGNGNSIDVFPSSSTTYYVRAEGGSNTTSCKVIPVSVNGESQKPSAVIGPSVVCQGDKATFSVSGGKLSGDGEWRWFSGGCDGKIVGTGQSIEIQPNESTTFYVRAEGACNATACASQAIEVDQSSDSPYGITAPSTIKKGKKATLEINGGRLGLGADWVWYEGNCTDGKKLGTGNSLVVKAKKEDKTYSLRGEGACNTTACVTTTISPLIVHRLDPTFETDTRSNKFMHLGAGLGLEFISFSANSTSTVGIVDPADTVLQLAGMGIKGQLSYHPIIKDAFSYGIHASAALGTTPLYIVGGAVEKVDYIKNEQYFYNRISLENEIAVGFESLKVLGMHRISIQSHKYSRLRIPEVDPSTELRYDNNFRRELIGGGARLGSYSKSSGKHRGVTFDFIYYLWSDYAWEWSDPSLVFKKRDEWNAGVGVVIWVQSAVKIRADIFSQKSKLSDDGALKDAVYQVSFLYNRNGFY